MKHFLKLVRPLNLVIIALTMYGIRVFYLELNPFKIDPSNGVLQEQIDFFFLVFSTVLIAAAGNVINDYFDVKADRINRPDRLIITKHIKRRSAIIIHWLLNGFAFLIGIYLSIRYHTFWYVFIHLISINVLWFYSMYFKRKAVIGNLLIASLTAMVPILTGIHFFLVGDLQQMDAEICDADFIFSIWNYLMAENGRLIFGMAFFAFVLNFVREIVKDMQDVKGDELLYAKTLPMLIGLRKTALLAAVGLVSVPVVALTLYMVNIHNLDHVLNDLIYFLPMVLALILTLLICMLLVGKSYLQKLKRIDFLLKISMLLGLLLPFYWCLRLF